jgi:hypothetical protein
MPAMTKYTRGLLAEHITHTSRYDLHESDSSKATDMMAEALDANGSRVIYFQLEY